VYVLLEYFNGALYIEHFSNCLRTKGSEDLSYHNAVHVCHTTMW